ncbi:hypothetical protein F4802DRAFT_469133 [Xylaria palmicola]|nr:hypothetical protein F4802DRAFT_469133 [Xylaria palmicola]
MALLGWSLILASVVYIAIRRPPLVETLIALCRRSPRIQQPPSTRPPAASTDDADGTPNRGLSSAVYVARPGISVRRVETKAEGEAMGETDRNPTPKMPVPPPPVVIEGATDEPVIAEIPAVTIAPSPSPSPSPQTTPKAAATATPANGSTNGHIPSFSLPPSTTTSFLPSATAMARAASSAASMSMPPPPRPPRLYPVPTANAANAATASLAPPPHPSPLPNRQYTRQPGTSTLAPPPTHASKPAKPSRKVTLEPGHSPLDWARLANHPTADLRNLGPGAGSSYLRVPPSLLRRHNGRRGADAWTALGGRVYNIAPYLPFHPGGEPELLRAAGRDGTRLFGEIHPWVNYETMLSSCLVGLLVDESEAVSGGEMEAMD